jgi:6-phosphofructokinase 1
MGKWGQIIPFYSIYIQDCVIVKSQDKKTQQGSEPVLDIKRGPAMRRIGVLTSGGDCPGLNAAIRSVVRCAKNVYQVEVLGLQDGYHGLLPNGCARAMDLDDVRGIMMQGGTILGTTNRGPFDVDAHGNPKEGSEAAFTSAIEQYQRLELDGLVVIGGDGSLRIARALHKMGLNIVGVPKTIDNDLSGTDRTFGFDTAVSIATEALDRLHTVAAAHHRIMICEVMGRESGWIALHAGLASGADAILIPEILFSWDPLLRMVAQRRARGASFSLIVVAEGACEIGGCLIYQAEGRLGGIGNRVASELQRLTGIETRVTVLGHVQRGGTPTAYDRLLASRFGEAAVHLLAGGGFGRVVSLRGENIVDVPLDEALAFSNTVPVDGQLVRLARSTGSFLGDEPPRSVLPPRPS